MLSGDILSLECSIIRVKDTFVHVQFIHTYREMKLCLQFFPMQSHFMVMYILNFFVLSHVTSK